MRARKRVAISMNNVQNPRSDLKTNETIRLRSIIPEYNGTCLMTVV